MKILNLIAISFCVLPIHLVSALSAQQNAQPNPNPTFQTPSRGIVSPQSPARPRQFQDSVKPRSPEADVRTRAYPEPQIKPRSYPEPEARPGSNTGSQRRQDTNSFDRARSTN
jgi:hypothetical protein